VTEPIWLGEPETLALHDRLLALDGGASGLRDPGLLASALARPRQHHAYESEADLAQLAAFYTAGVVKNHPFIDGNKRTGFLIGALFLELNGLRLTADEAETAAAVAALAAGAIDVEGYAAFLRANTTRAQPLTPPPARSGRSSG
jgi:death on curing protein